MNDPRSALPDDIAELIKDLAYMVWISRCECDLSKPLSKNYHDSAERIYKRADETAKKYGVRL